MTAALASADAPELVELPCPECGELVKGKASGPGSAPMKLGNHRRRKHGVIGTKNKRGRPRAGEPSDDEHVEHPITAGVRSAAAAAGGGKRVPTADDLAKGLGRGLALATYGAASLMVESDPFIPRDADGDRLRDGLIADLSLSEDGAVSIMRPLGRVLAPTKLNTKYGQAVVENADIVGSFFECAQIVARWREYLNMRSVRGAAVRNGGRPPLAPVPNAGAGMAPAPVPTAAEQITGLPLTVDGDFGPQTPPPTEGMLLTDAQIMALQQARAAANGAAPTIPPTEG